MTDKDTITLPREVVEGALEALDSEHPDIQLRAAIALRNYLAAPRLEVTVDPRLTAEEAAAISAAIDARKKEQSDDLLREFRNGAFVQNALAAEQPKPKPEPVAYFDLQKQVFYWARPTMIDVPKTIALEPLPLYAAPPATHPGYVIGSHWLETAYSRICAGEAEADVLRDCGWERVDEALRRDAERYRWLREKDGIAVDVTVFGSMEANLDAAIDAAMEGKR